MKSLKRTVAVILIFAFIFVGGTIIVNANKQDNKETRKKYYTSIYIESEETLWNIAKKYKSEEYSSIKEYIDELKFMNGLTNDIIHQGNHLTIAYYAS